MITAITECKACGMPMRVVLDNFGKIMQVFKVCKCEM